MTRGTTADSGGDMVLGDAQNWAARSHRELYEAVHVNNDPARAGELAQEWTRIGRELAESTQQLTERMRGTESGWQGTAASAARSAIQKLVDWNRTTGELAEQLGNRIAAQGRVMETAKTEMPEPVEVSGDLDKQAAQTYAEGDLAAFAAACKDLRAQHARSDSAHQQAVEVMTRMEEQSRTVDRDTPRFTTPPDPIQEETARRTPVQPDASPAGAGGGAGQSAPANQPAAAQPLSAPPTAQPAGNQPAAAQPLSAPAAQPAGNQPAAAQPAAPKLEPTTGGHVSQQHGATPLSAYSQQSGGDTAARSGSTQSGSHGDAPTKKFRVADVQSGAHGAGDDAVPPRLEDVQPDSTSSQSATPTHTATPNSGRDTLHNPRAMQGPDGSTAISGRPVTPKDKRDDSDRPRRGWSAQLPPIPSTSDAGAGNAGDSRAGGSAPVPPIPSTGGAGNAGVGGGGPAGDFGASASELPSGGKAGVGGAVSGSGGGGQSAAGSSDQTTGGSDQSRMGGVGAMPAGAGAQGRGGNQDEERSTKYVEGGPVVEVPGADLPPPVIGEGRQKKKQQQQQQQQDEG